MKKVKIFNVALLKYNISKLLKYMLLLLLCYVTAKSICCLCYYAMLLATKENWLQNRTNSKDQAHNPTTGLACISSTQPRVQG